nr:MAG TPA: hypothetical protein [Caudoviricetes sp.]
MQFKSGQRNRQTMWHYLPSVLPTLFRRIYKCRYLI